MLRSCNGIEALTSFTHQLRARDLWIDDPSRGKTRLAAVTSARHPSPHAREARRIWRRTRASKSDVLRGCADLLRGSPQRLPRPRVRQLESCRRIRLAVAYGRPARRQRSRRPMRRFLKNRRAQISRAAVISSPCASTVSRCGSSPGGGWKSTIGITRSPSGPRTHTTASRRRKRPTYPTGVWRCRPERHRRLPTHGGGQFGRDSWNPVPACCTVLSRLGSTRSASAAKRLPAVVAALRSCPRGTCEQRLGEHGITRPNDGIEHLARFRKAFNGT